MGCAPFWLWEKSAYQMKEKACGGTTSLRIGRFRGQLSEMNIFFVKIRRIINEKIHAYYKNLREIIINESDAKQTITFYLV